MPALKLRELARAVAPNARTFETVDYADVGSAVTALRNGRVNGVLTIPPGLFAARAGEGIAARRADRGQHRRLRVGVARRRDGGPRAARTICPRVAPQRMVAATALDVVEVYPYVPYIQYLLPGSIVMSIFMMVMIGGGIIFIDDKARGLHEGYLVTPDHEARIDPRASRSPARSRRCSPGSS